MLRRRSVAPTPNTSGRTRPRAAHFFCALAVVGTSFVVTPAATPLHALAAGAPTVAALSPESGAALGGTTLTVTGTNFVAGSTSVSFGSLSGSAVTVTSSTQLTVVSPAEPIGEVTVTVTTTAGGSSAANPPHSTFLVVPSGQYIPVTATRICDTRTGNSTPCAGHRLGSDVTYQVTVGGAGGIPTTAVAAIVNVTAVAPSALGLLELYPYGLAQPSGSDVSYYASTNIANLVEVPLGTGGEISVYNGSTGTTDMLIDVEGYIPATSTGAAGRMNLLATAARICDTRPSNSTQCSGGAHWRDHAHDSRDRAGRRARVWRTGGRYRCDRAPNRKRTRSVDRVPVRRNPAFDLRREFHLHDQCLRPRRRRCWDRRGNQHL
jgi:hypothetical protein